MSTGSSLDGRASRRLTSWRGCTPSSLLPKRTVSSKSSYFFFGVTGASGVVNPGTEGTPVGALGALVTGAPPVIPVSGALVPAPPAGEEGSSGLGVGVGVALGLNGSFGEPST